MASIRRTLSPAFRDRPYVNGVGSPFSVQSPSPKLLSSSRYSPPFPSAILAFTVHHPALRRRRFLLGLLPFGHVDDDEEIRGRSFNFDIKPSHVNVQFDNDNTDRVVKRREGSRRRQTLAVLELGQLLC
ncbi:hypothetical protein L3X38_008737 [Prunus dulcis]|uniref:Uncharacterized protein n=1 Tax=Prunus dulcis TaxID=3755 RepID=A0AAD4ZX40_PRUDU|nr:hypothetical protein L3X38_008737 [Prunus dulcis]